MLKWKCASSLYFPLIIITVATSDYQTYTPVRAHDEFDIISGHTTGACICDCDICTVVKSVKLSETAASRIIRCCCRTHAQILDLHVIIRDMEKLHQGQFLRLADTGSSNAEYMRGKKHWFEDCKDLISVVMWRFEKDVRRPSWRSQAHKLDQVDRNSALPLSRRVRATDMPRQNTR